MKTLIIYEAVDGPPDMHIHMGFEWLLEDENGQVIAECDHGFKTLKEVRSVVKGLDLNCANVRIIEIGKYNPFDPQEYPRTLNAVA